MEEIWRDVVGYEGHYQVSNLGRVRSVDKYVKSGGLFSDSLGDRMSLKKGKILKSSLTVRGYTRVSLSIESKTRQYFVHRIVAEAFLEKINGKENVNHINGIKTDNNLSNLEWVNQRENFLHNKIFIQKKEFPFVCYMPKYNRFEASILVNKKTIKLGRFKTEEEAVQSYVNKLKEIGVENKYILTYG